MQQLAGTGKSGHDRTERQFKSLGNLSIWRLPENKKEPRAVYVVRPIARELGEALEHRRDQCRPIGGLSFRRISPPLHREASPSERGPSGTFGHNSGGGCRQANLSPPRSLGDWNVIGKPEKKLPA